METNKATGRWRNEETDVLLEAWISVHGRRVQGERDPWVPEAERSRLSRSRDLCPDDWRALATAVNAWRASSGDHNVNRYHRTHQQCKNRIQNLKARYFNERCKAAPSKWYLFAKLHAIFAEPHQRAENGGTAGERVHEAVNDGATQDGGGRDAATGHGFVPVRRILKRRRSPETPARSGERGVAPPPTGGRGSSSVILSIAAVVVMKGLEVINKSIDVERERDAAARAPFTS